MLPMFDTLMQLLIPKLSDDGREKVGLSAHIQMYLNGFNLFSSRFGPFIKMVCVF